MENYIEVSSGTLNEGDFVCVTTYVDSYSNLKDYIPLIFKYTNGVLYDSNGISLEELAMKKNILPPYYVVKVDNKHKYVNLFFKNNVENSIYKYADLTNRNFGTSCRDILDRSIKPGDICVILKEGKFYHIDSDMSDDNIEYLIMFSKTKFLKVNSLECDVITMSSSWNSITYIKVSANKELKTKLQSYINLVLDESKKKKEKVHSFKEDFISKKPGTVLSTAKSEVVYVYLGNYKLNVDLGSYPNLSLSPEYLNGGDMYVKIFINKNPGKTVYEKLISGTLSSSEFDSYLINCGINLGGYKTVDECIKTGFIYEIEYPLNPNCIEFGLSYRKFRDIIGVYKIPSSLSFNLRGKRSYKDLIYTLIPC